MRASTLLAAGHLCQRCTAAGRRAPAALVHHRKPIRSGGAPFEPENCEALCGPCHQALHQALEEKECDGSRLAWDTLIQELVTENRKS